MSAAEPSAPPAPLDHRRLYRRHVPDFWLARLAVAAVAALQLSLGSDVALGPVWLAPALELALLLPLSVATAWNQRLASAASTDAHWEHVGRHGTLIRRSAILLTAVASAMNSGALLQLIDALLHGHGGVGSRLLVDAIRIWAINVILFALWYWSVDRGGPSVRTLRHSLVVDFLFPQMTLGRHGAAPFSPGFVDYLFLSFTNSTAFSPTDTVPLTPRAKLLMMVQAASSLLTVALVAARAVNILQ
jgi:hypothetical protein